MTRPISKDRFVFSLAEDPVEDPIEVGKDETRRSLFDEVSFEENVIGNMRPRRNALPAPLRH